MDITPSLETMFNNLTPEQRQDALDASFDELHAARAHAEQLHDHQVQQAGIVEQIAELTRPYFAQLPAGASVRDVKPLMTEAQRTALDELTAQIQAAPAPANPILTISAVDPGRDYPCGLCGEETEAGEFAVTTYTVDGRYVVCDDCTEYRAPGLAEAAEALTDVHFALTYLIEQPHRKAYAKHLAELARLAEALHSGGVVLEEQQPDGTTRPVRVGGDDPQAVLRRHTLKPV
jgi:hypothetical protein